MTVRDEERARVRARDEWTDTFEVVVPPLTLARRMTQACSGPAPPKMSPTNIKLFLFNNLISEYYLNVNVASLKNTMGDMQKY